MTDKERVELGILVFGLYIARDEERGQDIIKWVAKKRKNGRKKQ